MHKWKKLVAGVLSASMIIPAAPLTAGATEQIEQVQQEIGRASCRERV